MNEGSTTNLTTDVEIKGTIKFDKVMNIEGKFEGELVTNDGELIVGKTGAIKANVKVKNATIEGRLDGNIVAAEKVVLKQKAQLLGDLQARTLVIEEGVVFVGKCNVNPDGAKIEKQSFSKPKKEEKEIEV
ncbi:MAG: Polymer-forming cytoskeletal [Candidatus Scalindua rubra]|uniref:Polymer-forming cytoskeletal n=1 Tax=Candidatus Scalindua rubra TaxID=1872076 RepID=A0A1E3X883_9BACT|nr:MAG: Polymer-forming cytoskeletal [Candidatus Scalindua rubra]